VQNGQTYYYAVTAYDFGFSGMVDGEPATFFPAETPKVITIDSDGSLRFDINTVSVVPGVQAAGYQEPVLGMARHTAGGASGVVYQEIVDPRMVPDGVNYRISFGGEGQVADTVYIHDDATDQLLYVQTLDDAVTNRKVLDEFDAYYQERYDDEFFETWTRFDVVEGEVFEGHRLYFVKPRESYAGNLIPNASGWSSTRGVEDSLLTFRFGIFSQSGYPTGERIYGDYEITFTDELDYEAEGITIESTSGGGDITLPPRAVNFRVMNTVTGERAPFAFAEASATVNGRINHNDQILMLKEVELEDGSLDTLPSWRILFRNSADSVQITLPERGDTLRLSLYKPFTPEDVFGYSSEAARVEQEEVELSRIKVYPNPYLATSSQEPKGLVDAGGRGERRINFIHLPDRCTIRIFNVRGELVDRIEHRSSIFDGSATWDLRSKDDLDVAYGIYLFHVESPYGEHTGKFALIK
jgi:hypothetical protein